jgi:16S rRNA (guanine1207-N2)-methyltransferase
MTPEFDFDQLRRWPDIEADNLFAFDATDRLLLDLAAPYLEDADVAVIGDNYGALTLGAIAHGATGVRVHQDDLVGELALAANADDAGFDEFTSLPLGQSLLEGATLVLLQLPRGLDELEEILECVARYADARVTVIAGGRIKHLTPTMNPVMLKYFDSLDVSLAQQKSRAFTLRQPHPVEGSRFPVVEFHQDIDLSIAAHGAVFAGSSIDIGTRLLLGAIRKAGPMSGTAIDLGCGTGVLAASLARSRPGLRVIATDQSAAAVASAAATMKANGLEDRVEVVRDDGLTSQPDASADLVLLNPPFHIGAVVHTGPAHRMFADAARVLKPGGELWTVFNTHLGYRQALARIVGPTELVTHNDKFTVTVSKRAGDSR